MIDLAGACDTHLHVYDGAFPSAPGSLLRPPDASLGDYRRVQHVLGLERLVVVQPTTYGLDNRLHLQALEEAGEHGRGVMVIGASTPADEVAAMSELGVRGARFHMLPGGAVGWDELEPVAELIAPFGWHIQLQLDGNELVDRVDRLRRLPVGLVIDHVGRFMPPPARDSAPVAALLSLVDDGAFVKLSAPYESTGRPGDDHPEVDALVAALVEHRSDRLLWATNWPHPGQTDPPSTVDLARWRDRWLPTDALRRQVLVDNPAMLYDF